MITKQNKYIKYLAKSKWKKNAHTHSARRITLSCRHKYVYTTHAWLSETIFRKSELKRDEKICEWILFNSVSDLWYVGINFHSPIYVLHTHRLPPRTFALRSADVWASKVDQIYLLELALTANNGTTCRQYVFNY